MMKIEWDCVKPLKNEKAVDVLEIKYAFKLPDDLKKCIKENNAGVPSPCAFDLGNNKGKIFASLLSFNREDADNVYDFLGGCETPDKKRLERFPFGIDPAGNLLCVENDKIVFYYCEREKSYTICESFTELMTLLHE